MPLVGVHREGDVAAEVELEGLRWLHDAEAAEDLEAILLPQVDDVEPARLRERIEAIVANLDDVGLDDVVIDIAVCSGLVDDIAPDVTAVRIGLRARIVGFVDLDLY